MKTITIAIQKGGQGKTFLACQMALYLAKIGKKIAIIDLDIQANTSYTLNKYKLSKITASQLLTEFIKQSNYVNIKPLNLFESDPFLADLAKLNSEKTTTFLKNNLQKLSKYYDYCIIDTPPSLGIQMITAIKSCDFLLAPLEMEPYAMEGLNLLLKIRKNLQAENTKMKFLGIVPNKVRKNTRQTITLNKLRNKYGNLILPTLGLRDSFSMSLAEKIPLWKIQKSAAQPAKNEMNAFINFLLEQIK